MESSHGDTESERRMTMEPPHGDTASERWMAMESSHGDTASVQRIVSLVATNGVACAYSSQRVFNDREKVNR
jgi:hypothetical protein